MTSDANGDSFSDLCDRPDLVSEISGDIVDDGGGLAPNSLDVENVSLASKFAGAMVGRRPVPVVSRV